MRSSRDSGEGGGREQDAPPSPRVQLEVDILAAESGSAQRADVPRGSTGRHRGVLAVTSDASLSRYVAHCLAVRSDLQLDTAESVPGALAVAQRQQPQLIVADTARAEVLRALADVPAILIVDDAADRASVIEPGPRAPASIVERPFNARSLLIVVEQLLGPSPP